MSEKVFVSTVSAGGARKLFKSVKYILISYAVSLILIAALSALVVYSGMPEKYAPLGVSIITYFSCFLSGLMTGAGSLSKGWLSGAASGVLNILILAVLAMAITGSVQFEAGFVLKLAIAALSGAVGGMFGINVNKE